MAGTETPTPIVFDEFFEFGLEESKSPFLTPSSRKWAHLLPFKTSILATILLVIAYILNFGIEPLSNIFLMGVYFLVGIPPLIDSIEDLSKLEINIDVLMTLAAFLSIVIGSPLEGGLLLVLFSLSGSMEDAVTQKAKGAISSLYKLSPSQAWILSEDEQEISPRSVKDIKPGDKILIKSHEIIPLDGLVIKGASSVNLAHLTGESMPVTIKVGDSVPAGALNLEGSLYLKVTHTSSDSTLAKIIQLVTLAQESKPQVELFFERKLKAYATIIITLTAFFAITLPLFFSMPFFGIEGSFYRAIAFLIAASPCALIISTPVAYLSAISSSAKKGILLKGGSILDTLAQCSIIAFDKTGTLTTGKLKVKSFEPPSLFALTVAKAMEMHIQHPIGNAIFEYAENAKVPTLQLQSFTSIPGFGITSEFIQDGLTHSAFLGKSEYLKLPENTLNRIKELQSQGDQVAILLIDQELFIFTLEDTLRPKIKEMIEELQASHLRLVMLTGDHIESAKKIATQLGIREYFANLKPEDKLNIVSELSEKEGLVMVGDGVNDAPALAKASVGIAMGKVASHTAIEAADVVFLNDNLELTGWLIQKAKLTREIVKENLTLALSVIFFATTPALLGLIPLWLAVVLHEGGTVLVGLNALRLLRK